jgi:hypothetical protein
MNKLALAASVIALVTAAPAVAEGRGGHSPRGPSHAAFGGGGPWGHVTQGLWRHAFFGPPGFFSPGRHLGWFFGRHWGWFRPHHPHWPHHPPHSP